MDNSLDIPEWARKVVPSVAEKAEELWELAGDRERTRIGRLISDPKMQRVWKTLTSAARKNRDWPRTAGERQLAAVQVFIAAVRGGLPATTSQHLKESPFVHMAQKLESTLDEMQGWEEFLTPGEEELLGSLIVKCRRVAAIQSQYPIVPRYVGDPVARGYLLSLVSAIREAFGTANINTSKTIASVALNAEIGTKAIREAASWIAEKR